MIDSELQTVLERLGGVSITARQAVESVLAGSHRSVRRGLSVAFAGHRAYQHGDDLRHLDWLVYARSDRYDVRLYDEETRLRATLVVDASGSHAVPEVSRRTHDLAAALIVLLARQGDAVGLALLAGAAAEHLPAAAGSGHLAHLLERLAERPPAGETALGAATEALAQHLPRRGLTILISDCLDSAASLERTIRVLRHRRQEVRVLRVLHPDVEDFPLSGPVRCVGPEGERPRLLDADRARPWYREAFATHATALAAACHQWGAGLAVVRTDEDLGIALARVLGDWGAPQGAAANRPGAATDGGGRGVAR